MAEPLDAIDARVADISDGRRRLLLRRAGVDTDNAAALVVPPEGEAARGWGFPTNLPPRHRLVEYLQQQAAAAAEAADADQRQQLLDARRRQQHGPRRAQLALPGEASAQAPHPQEQQQRPLLLELLQQSRTFQSPDCADAMADSLGVSDLHRCLRGSLLHDAAPEGEVARVRGLLRGALRTAWSKEALRRGVALAKQGDLKAALPCYDQALQLDGSNADALVARGAALANKRQWQRASNDLEAALELQPEHSNARQYLDAVKAKATEGGVRLLPRQASMQEQAADCQQQAAQQAAQQQQQQPAREAAAAVEGEEERQRREHRQQAAQQRQAADDERQRDAADGRGGRKRQRGSSSSRSRSRSRHRARGRTRSRSRSRSRGRRQRSSGSSSSSKGGSGGSDSEAEATAKRLAAAQAAAGGDLGKGMDVATALQIVSSHYKSRHGKKERGGKREHKGGSKQGKHSKQRHKKKKHRRH